MAAPSGLKVVARRTASRTEEANGASTRAAPRELKEAARLTASRTAGANGANTRAASSLLEATRGTVWGMARQAVPATKLHQVRSRRYAALVMNLQFSILMAQTTDPSSWR
jgi:hypothetical protein